MSLPTAASSISSWLGVWSRPPDRPAQAALALAVALFAVAAVPGGPRWLVSRTDLRSLTDLKRRRRFLAVASFVAAFLSLGYIAFYLRGGPRAQEASTYWLQGRALSHGLLAWTVPEPSASFRARDLLFRGPDRLSGSFAPGYPLLLAVGFLVGAPMLIGPLLAAALTVATWLLAHEVASDVGSTGAEPEAIARAAAGFSMASAALRYYTADALPHGAAALAMAVAIACGLRGRRTLDPRLFGFSGFALGMLAAMRPSSALAVAILVTVLAGWPTVGRTPEGSGRHLTDGGVRCVAWTFVAALPGLVLLLAANRTATGHAFVTPRSAYAAVVGRDDHFDVLVLGGSLLRRAREHLVDIANFEPLALLTIVPLVAVATRRRAALVAVVIAAEVAWRWAVHLGATPSMYSHSLVVVVPLEHALMAVGLGLLFPRSFAPAVVVVLALALAGFAVHSSYAHEAVATSDLGHPSFEPDVAREANVNSGLLFFDDDRGYKLAFDPGVGASHGIEAVRLRGDDHDRLLYDSLGHPPAHRYVMSETGPSVALWMPPNGGSSTWRFEAESDWPPLSLEGGSTQAVSVENGCASGGRVLRLSPYKSEAEASLAIELPIPGGPGGATMGIWRVSPRVLQHGSGGKGVLILTTPPATQTPMKARTQSSGAPDPPLAEWEWTDAPNPQDSRPMPITKCIDLPPHSVELGSGLSSARLILRATGGSVALDKTTLWLEGEALHR